MMEGGDAHLGHRGQIFDAQRLGVVCLEPTDGLGGAVALLAQRGDGAQVAAKRATEDAIDDFALHEAGEEWDVAGGIEQVEEAAASTEEFRRGFADGQAARAERGFGGEELVLAEDLAYRGHLELENQGEERLAF